QPRGHREFRRGGAHPRSVWPRRFPAGPGRFVPFLPWKHLVVSQGQARSSFGKKRAPGLALRWGPRLAWRQAGPRTARRAARTRNRRFSGSTAFFQSVMWLSVLRPLLHVVRDRTGQHVGRGSAQRHVQFELGPVIVGDGREVFAALVR